MEASKHMATCAYKGKLVMYAMKENHTLQHSSTVACLCYQQRFQTQEGRKSIVVELAESTNVENDVVDGRSVSVLH